jgi:hypothetical protein
MNIPTGLHDNWNGGVAAYRHSVSIASAMSIDQSADEPGVGNGSDVEMPNGFSDNEEGEQAERAGIKPGHMPRPEDRYQFLGKKPSSAKVVNKVSELTSVPTDPIENKNVLR